jgi:hypothetical protein
VAIVTQPEQADEPPSARIAAAATATPLAVDAPVAEEPVGPASPAVARGLRRLRSLRTFESLANPNFRWYELSQVGAHGAGHMHSLVTGILVFQLTGSFAALGAIALATAVPGLTLSLAGGVIADRLPKRLVQQTSTLLNALNALVLAMLLVAGLLRYEHLLASAVIQGTVSGLMMPSRQSMIPDIVLPRHVMNAVALNNATMTTSRMVMPGIGGVLIALTASYWAYFVIVGCHLFSIVTLFKVPAKAIDVPPTEQVRGREAAARTAEPAKRQSGLRDPRRRDALPRARSHRRGAVARQLRDGDVLDALDADGCTDQHHGYRIGLGVADAWPPSSLASSGRSARRRSRSSCS